ncbi:MAG: HAD hydrolase-like protein [Actinomycetota bacterium]|nr:HAD hydrolase-like protein [Actinomycetota bacterium]
MAQTILFDIDGTLLRSGGSSDRAWHRAFEQLHGVDVDIAAVTGRGVPDPAVGLQAFQAVIGREPTPEEMAKLMGKRLEFLPEEVANSKRYRVMPGVDQLLERLIDEGTLLGLTTGNVESAAHIKLSRANLNRFFSFGGYGSDSSDRTELTRRALERGQVVSGGKLDLAATFSVGDTPRDIEAGHGAGIRVVGVATGDYSAEQLSEAGADAVIEDLSRGLPPLAA